MNAKVSILILLIFGALLQAGCNFNSASGENSKVIQVIGDKSKAAGVQQDVPEASEKARLQEEARLANERAQLAEEKAELEKQKREFAEAQLKQQEGNTESQEGGSSEENTAEDESPAPAPRRRAARPHRCCYDAQSSYTQPDYSSSSGYEPRPAATQNYPRPQPRYADYQRQPQPAYPQQTQPAPTTILVVPQREQPVESPKVSQRTIVSSTIPQPEKKKMSKWKKLGIAAGIIGGAVITEEVIRRNW